MKCERFKSFESFETLIKKQKSEIEELIKNLLTQ